MALKKSHGCSKSRLSFVFFLPSLVDECSFATCWRESVGLWIAPPDAEDRGQVVEALSKVQTGKNGLFHGAVFLTVADI